MPDSGSSPAPPVMVAMPLLPRPSILAAVFGGAAWPRTLYGTAKRAWGGRLTSRGDHPAEEGDHELAGAPPFSATAVPLALTISIPPLAPSTS
ncbi:hypothetical protein GCM10009416_30640 [Craurococcus roseus]|uniref:Uncharacterized protein n=1 Tax=Craurococcus roseus TaxID=77585 RepID=A0ABP3QJ89_9PROT